MTPQELRTSILQLAIQGKLVPQLPEEGTGEELFQQIQAEKQALIKAGKIKKEKTLPEIADDIPFDIPETWKWVKLGNICSICTGKKDANFGSDTGKYFFFTCAKEPIRCDSFSFSGESILLAGNGDIGNISYYVGEFEAYQRTYVLQPYMDQSYLLYVLYHLKSNWVAYNIDKMFGTAIPYIRLGNVQNYLVALPPESEQKRIVAKIEALLPLIDRYEAAWNKLEEFNKRFPGDMQKSILQLAIQGKLVEQRPEEGTGEELFQQIQAEKQALIKAGKIKKEKPLPEITEDEIPFEIPNSWKWVRLGQCGTFVRGSGIKKDDVVSTGFPCVRYGQLYTHYKTKFRSAVSFVPETIFQKCHKIFPSDILMALTGENNFDIALAVTYTGIEPIAMGGDMTKFTGYFIDPLYFTYVINSPYGIECKSKLATGNIIVHISNDKLSSIPVPLPPYAEQKRIVAKLEEILPLCERLK